MEDAVPAPPAWLRGVRTGRRVADVVCRTPGRPVVVAVVHRGDDGRLRLATIGGELGPLEALAGREAQVYECGCHHRIDAIELERVVELAVGGPRPMAVDVDVVGTRV